MSSMWLKLKEWGHNFLKNPSKSFFLKMIAHWNKNGKPRNLNIVTRFLTKPSGTTRKIYL